MTFRRLPAFRSLARRPAAAVVMGMALSGSAGCGRSGEASSGASLELFTAGALALPLRAAADSFAALRGGPPALLEAAGSLETVRKLTELQRTPDVVAVADADLLAELLVPRWTSWYVVIARDRMVLAYTSRSRGADAVNATNWPDVVAGDGVLVGRSDPDRDPAGYRALLAMRLAERHYGRAGLAGRLLEHAPARLMRPKSADLVALLQAGELDYAWAYASTARAAGLRTVELPGAVNLGDPALADAYAAESVLVAGRRRGDTLAVHGRPVLFAITIPTSAPHAGDADGLVAWLLGPDGRRVLAGAGLDLLPRPLVVGRAVPAAVAQAVGTAPAGPDSLGVES